MNYEETWSFRRCTHVINTEWLWTGCMEKLCLETLESIRGRKGE
jgi:hypothetical protein